MAHMADSHQALDAMTDSGAFERLATDVLRRIEPLGRAVAHMGVNALGKTVASPVDGLAILANATECQIVIHQHSVVERKKLRQKWLGTNEDVAKTRDILVAERKRNPEVRMTLFLSTNRVPSEKLIRDVHTVGREAGMDIIVLERSRIADFLDNDPDGQWLRARYLGIEQVRLSADELLRLGGTSVEHYKTTFSDDPSIWVNRDFEPAICMRIATRGFTLLVMPSGSGKSTVAVRTLVDRLASGNPGLWLPERAVADSLTLTSALSDYLRAIAPKISPMAGDDALRLSRSRPLLLVVDDLNRLGDAQAVLEKLCAWGAQLGRQGAGDAHLLIPVWPQVFHRLDASLRKACVPHILEADGFTEQEASAAMQARAAHVGISISKLAAAERAAAFGRDPLLIGLWDPTNAQASEASTVLASFVADCCVAVEDSTLSAADLAIGVDRLAFRMLLEGVMIPTWNNVRKWFVGDPDTISALRRLIEARRLLRLEGDSGDARLIFRHDRVRAALFAKALRRRMDADTLDENLWREPYYADFLGDALSQNAVEARHIEHAKRANPQVLAFTLEALANAEPASQAPFVDAMIAWIDSSEGKSAGSETLRWEIQLVLMRIDAPFVSKICAHFTEWTWALDIARFRNGNVRSGAAYCYSNYPSLQSGHRDALVAHVRDRHRVALLSEIPVGLLIETNPKLIVGYLHLAGELGFPELADAVLGCWGRIERNPTLIPAFLWAASRCGQEHPARYLDPILSYWESLPEPEEGDSFGTGRRVVDESSGHAMRRGLPTPVVSHLVNRADVGDDIGRRISVLLLDDLDDPDAQAQIARAKAVIAKRIEGTDRFSPWLTTVRREIHPPKVPFSNATRQAVATMWQDTYAERHLRQQAFYLWRSIALEEDLPLLLGIGPEDLLYAPALKLRARLGDMTSLPAIRTEMAKGIPHQNWWEPFRQTWFDEMESALDDEFARWASHGGSDDTSAHFYLPEIVMHLQPAIAERILTKHWATLKGLDRFIHVALYVATPTTIALAHRTIEVSENRAAVLQYITQHWEVGGTESRGQLTIARLEAIKPYLLLLDEMDVYHLWTASNYAGLFNWRREHLDAFLSSKWSSIGDKDDADLLHHFDTLSEQRPGGAYFLVEQSIKRDDPPDRVPTLLRRWMTERASIEALRVVGECLTAIGRRDMLNILDIPAAPSCIEADAIRANTRYSVMRRALN